MPITIKHPDNPGHVMTFDATSNKTRIIARCSCGKDFSITKMRKGQEAVLRLMQRIDDHLRPTGSYQ